MDSRNKMIKIFNDALAKNGPDSPEAVCWGTRRTQYFRFKILCDIAGLFGDKSLVILDWGCGLGDLLEYLRFQGFTGTYIGADINKEFIAEARKKYADDPHASFFVSESLRDAARLQYDYCLLSGVFNIAAEDTGAELKKTVQALFKGARRGVAFNALSTHAKEKKSDLAYFDPFALGEWCAREITPYVALRQDYRGGNFTVYLYKDRGVDF